MSYKDQPESIRTHKDLCRRIKKQKELYKDTLGPNGIDKDAKGNIKNP